MLTKELQAYDRLPEEVKPAILALSVLIGRIGSLPRSDRGELFELLTDWRKADDPEEQRSIKNAMEEILAQVPITARRMDLSEERPLGRSRRGWAEWVGNKIKELRERAGLTQTELANKAGLDQSHVSRLENAEFSPTNLTIRKIAKALKVSIGSLDPCDEEPCDD